MTGFVTWRIRCQPRLNITPAHYHNQPSNECGRWRERLGWIREKGFSTLHSGGWVTDGLNRRCTVPLALTEGLLWVARLESCDAGETRRHRPHTHQQDWKGAETQRQARGSIWGLLPLVYPQLWILMCGAITEDRGPVRETPALDHITLSLKWGERIIKMQTPDQTSFISEEALAILRVLFFLFTVHLNTNCQACYTEFFFTDHYLLKKNISI